MLKAATVGEIKHQGIPVLNRYSRTEAADLVQNIVRKAGYEHCTPIQQNIVPFIFQGRDFFIETLQAKGKTFAALAIALLRVEYTKTSTQCLIITADPREVSKLQCQFEKIPPELKKNLRTAPLGYEKNPKRELKYFQFPPNLIIGTTERIIDHLRRDNIDIQTVELLLILDNTVEEHDGFLQDILFITSKTVNLQQRIVFSSIANHAAPLLEHLHRPHIMNYSDWSNSTINHISYPIHDGKDKINAVKTLLHRYEGEKTVLITKNPSIAGSLEKRLSAEGFGRDDVTVTTYKKIDSSRSIDFSTIIFYQFPADYHLYARILKKVAAPGEHTAFISLLQEKERKFFETFKEEYKVDIKEDNLPQEKDAVLRGYIENAVRAIKEEETPEVLDVYKKIVKKHVPFFLRGYFTAYLLKQVSGGQAEAGPATTLFVSVGKNRKVFPRDLSKLFSSAVKIDPATIGQIKILDSYSFIDVPAHRAQEAIDALNGQEYRGRKLTVNYARKKD